MCGLPKVRGTPHSRSLFHFQKTFTWMKDPLVLLFFSSCDGTASITVTAPRLSLFTSVCNSRLPSLDVRVRVKRPSLLPFRRRPVVIKRRVDMGDLRSLDCGSRQEQYAEFCRWIGPFVENSATALSLGRLCLRKVVLWSDLNAPWHNVIRHQSHARQGTAVVFDRPLLLEVIAINFFIVIIQLGATKCRQASLKDCCEPFISMESDIVNLNLCSGAHWACAVGSFGLAHNHFKEEGDLRRWRPAMAIEEIASCFLSKAGLLACLLYSYTSL